MGCVMHVAASVLVCGVCEREWELGVCYSSPEIKRFLYEPQYWTCCTLFMIIPQLLVEGEESITQNKKEGEEKSKSVAE